jgi:outer membrane protein OmpA-like peptidoglycan-associated protein
MDRRTGLVLVAVALGGCAAVAPVAPGSAVGPAAPPPTPAPAPAPRNEAEQRAGAASALTTARQWLQSWFEGTPVLIEQHRNGPLAIEVPQPFGFDAGRSEVKPPLAAVLDKLAQSLRRMPLTRLTLVAAPGEPGKPDLGTRRAEQVRRRLLARGVPADRIGPPSVSTAAAVQLRVEIVAA